MLNSYSSMYKQSQQNREKSRGGSGSRPTDMQPEKESAHQQSARNITTTKNNYGDIINR